MTCKVVRLIDRDRLVPLQSRGIYGGAMFLRACCQQQGDCDLKRRKSNMLKTPMTATLLLTSGSHTDAQMKAMGQIYQSLQQQGSILSYIDVLQTLAIFCACMVPLVLLMSKASTAVVH
jgi:hypothetical protein